MRVYQRNFGIAWTVNTDLVNSSRYELPEEDLKGRMELKLFYLTPG